MSQLRKPSSKYSLVFATLIAFSCVCTAGVSTFAWFQANSRVSISPESATTNITVSSPDEIELGADPTIYAYNDNFTYVDGEYTNHGYTTSSESNKVSMVFEKGSSNNYFYSYTSSASSAGYNSSSNVTKVYSGHIISVIPESGFTISSILFSTNENATTYSSILQSGTWNNGVAVRTNNYLVTVTPEDGDETVEVTLGGSVWIDTVRIIYTDTTYTEWDLTENSYAYCGDNSSAYLDSSNKATSMAWFSSNTPAIISRDFTPLSTSALKNSLLSTDMLTPGHKLTFAIKAVATSNISQADFYLEKYTSKRLLNRKKLADVDTESDYPIAIDEAMRIYSSVNSSGWYFGSSLNRFSFNYATTPDSTILDDGENIQTIIYDSEGSYGRVNLGGSDVLASETVYFFFTIEFSNVNSTYYQEYNAIGGALLSRPNPDYIKQAIYNAEYKYYSSSDGVYSYANPQPANQTQVTNGTYYTASSRYFLPSTSGKSNCYAGLTFQINRIELELA